MITKAAGWVNLVAVLAATPFSARAPLAPGPMADDLKPMEAPITLERSYLVGGKRITFQVVFPASLGKEIGLENAYTAAQKIILRCEGKNIAVKELKLGE
jgi:hypothetical protein